MRLIFAVTILLFSLLSENQASAVEITDEQAIIDGFWTGCGIQKYCANDYTEEDTEAVERGKRLQNLVPEGMSCERLLREVPLKDTIEFLKITKSVYESDGTPTCLSKVKELQ